MTIKKVLLSNFVPSLLMALSAHATEANQEDKSANATSNSMPNRQAVALQLDYAMKDFVALNDTTNQDNFTSISNLPTTHLDLSLTIQPVESPLAPAAPELDKVATFAIASRAEEEIANIEARRHPRIETGFEKRDKSATDGSSTYHGEEIPLVGWWPIGYDGHGFVQVDHVSIDAGELANNKDAYLFGKLAAKQFIPPTPLFQKAEGTSIAGGYVGDDLRWDVGIIGIGFPVQNLVGGIRKSWEVEKMDYALELSRRPQTSSLLSYAGARDPATGEIWGGVTNTALSGRAATYFGEIYAFASAEYGLLQGKNVLDNNRLALRMGLDKDLIHHDDMRLNLGLTLSYWRFKENETNYTFGHGGYYSPQNYSSLSLPLEWVGRHNKLSYLVRGSVSFSQSHEKDMSFYPTDNALQNSSPAGYQVYKGGAGNGTGYALRLTAEYQATPQFAIGGRVDIERSAYYEPNTLLLYLKYDLQLHQPSANFPPAVVKPLSQF